MAAAEAVFAKQPPKQAVAPMPPRSGVPVGKETVSLKLDRDVLDYFQNEGPGWQDRINAALRQAAGDLGSVDEGKRPEDLNATNDD